VISDLYRKIRIVKKYGYIRLVPECRGILKKRFFLEDTLEYVESWVFWRALQSCVSYRNTDYDVGIRMCREL